MAVIHHCKFLHDTRGCCCRLVHVLCSGFRSRVQRAQQQDERLEGDVARRPPSLQQMEEQATWRAARRRWLASTAAALGTLRDPVAALKAHFSRLACDASSSVSSAVALAVASGRSDGEIGAHVQLVMADTGAATRVHIWIQELVFCYVHVELDSPVNHQTDSVCRCLPKVANKSKDNRNL